MPHSERPQAVAMFTDTLGGVVEAPKAQEVSDGRPKEERISGQIASRLHAVCIDYSSDFDPDGDPITRRFLGVIERDRKTDETPRPTGSRALVKKLDRMELNKANQFADLLKSVLARMVENGNKYKGEDSFKGLPRNVTLRNLMLLRIYDDVTYISVAEVLLQFISPDKLLRENLISIAEYLADNYTWKELPQVLDVMAAIENRQKPGMVLDAGPRKHYGTDLQDVEWDKIQALLSIGGLSPSVAREIVNAILYHEDNDCPLHKLPQGFPDADLAFTCFKYWKKEGIWAEVKRILEEGE